MNTIQWLTQSEMGVYRMEIATNNLSENYKKQLYELLDEHGFDVVFETANNVGILDDTNFHILRNDLNKLNEKDDIK